MEGIEGRKPVFGRRRLPSNANEAVLIGITLIFVSLHSYNSLCNRGSALVLVIWLPVIQLYWKLYSDLQILLDM